MEIRYPSYIGQGLETAEVGKVYAVAFPFALSHPCIIGQTFVAHRHITKPERWAVTHLQSGMMFSEGRTRKDAIDAAAARFMRFGEDSMRRALERGIETYKQREAITGSAPRSSHA